MKRSLTLFICLILMLLVFAIAEDSPEPIRLAEIEDGIAVYMDYIEHLAKEYGWKTLGQGI